MIHALAMLCSMLMFGIVASGRTLDVDMPTMHAGQWLVFTSTARTVIALCGRRWGKSLVGLLMVCREIAAGRRVLWVGPVFRTIEVAWQRIKVLLAPLAASGLVRISESRMEIAWGATGLCAFRSAEADAGLRGDGGFSLIVCDEGSRIPERVFHEVIRPMGMDSPTCRVFIPTTPASRGGWVETLYRRGIENPGGDVQVFRFPSSDNPHLSAQAIEEVRDDLSPTAYAREILADPDVSDDSVLFPNLVRGPPLECTTRTLGCDLAISQKTSADFTCLCVMGRAADSTLWVLHAQRGHWTMRETVQNIIATATAWNTRKVQVERVAYQAAAVDELQRMPELAGYTVDGIVPHGDKQSRAAPMSSRVASGAIRFADSLPEWFTSEITSFPLARRDDAVDAMQLAFAGLATAGSRYVALIERMGREASAAEKPVW